MSHDKSLTQDFKDVFHSTENLVKDLFSKETFAKLGHELQKDFHAAREAMQGPDPARLRHDGLPDIALVDHANDVEQFVVGKFDNIDKNHTGKITPADIDAYMKERGSNLSEYERDALKDVEKNFPNGATKEQVQKLVEQEVKRSAMLV